MISAVSYKCDNTTFKGIRLSGNNFIKVGKIINSLKFLGYNCFGYRKFYVDSSSAVGKKKLFDYVRNHNTFKEKDFGVLFLPWNKEAYFISSLENERLMIDDVRKVDKKAGLNLFL